MSASAVRRSAAEAALPPRSAWAFSWFRKYVRRYVRKRFHAVRLSKGGFRPDAGSPPGPVVVVLNHPSWWDPMIGLVLSECWPGRAMFAPMDASALLRYRFFERLGFFGVEPDSPRGGLAFLRRGLAVLHDPNAVLWVTAQGRFVDVRDRPVVLKNGVGRLAARAGAGCVLPLALEYGFWEENTPEAFARFGPPIALDGTDPADASAWTSRIARALEATQDALAVDVASRDPSGFESVLEGGAGVGGVYDLWRRVKAAARRERFVARHGGRLEAGFADLGGDRPGFR